MPRQSQQLQGGKDVQCNCSISRAGVPTCLCKTACLSPIHLSPIQLRSRCQGRLVAVQGAARQLAETGARGALVYCVDTLEGIQCTAVATRSACSSDQYGSPPESICARVTLQAVCEDTPEGFQRTAVATRSACSSDQHGSPPGCSQRSASASPAAARSGSSAPKAPGGRCALSCVLLSSRKP